jgi:hypothetical protein
VNGTTAAAIAANAEIRLAPMYPRRTVFDAVCDNVVALYPDLSRIATTTVTSASTPVNVPAELTNIRYASRASSGRVSPVGVELLRSYTPAATGQAIQFSGVNAGVDVYLTYEARFDRPTDEADDLDDFGVQATWERIIIVGTAAQVLAGRAFDAISAEYINEQLEREGLPVGSIDRMRDNLIRYHRHLLDQARRDQRADRVTPVVMNV